MLPDKLSHEWQIDRLFHLDKTVCENNRGVVTQTLPYKYVHPVILCAVSSGWMKIVSANIHDTC